MKTLCIALSVLIFCNISACTGGPTKPIAIDNKHIINSSYDKTWTKALQTLASEGYPIQNYSKEIGNISTGKKSVKLQTIQADCGKYMGFAYLSDDRTVTTVSYNIFLRDLSNGKTEATVNTEIEGTYQAGAGKTNILNCYSLGILERELLNKLD
ncbi:MAG: hypothetical protein NTX45_09350 [Proteobacteria bacterium]|nr:hypothetical protein [Pseudomonadota bacterium]